MRGPDGYDYQNCVIFNEIIRPDRVARIADFVAANLVLSGL
jgi:hypothetical protein